MTDDLATEIAARLDKDAKAAAVYYAGLKREEKQVEMREALAFMAGAEWVMERMPDLFLKVMDIERQAAEAEALAQGVTDK